ncbi:MAG TPA: chlororespiratory reduction protein 7 [Prochlorococcaceae cyanobacterium AMR_MDS_5431]|nr:chlororespiratory reduction protein 7 [Prochlorococcaceae cyanobacterium AMR_MDS_5431]
MLNPLIRQLDYYVVLEPNFQEQILTGEETLLWLIYKLETLTPASSKSINFSPCQIDAQYLLETVSELEFSPGKKIQWYATNMIMHS